MTTEQITLLKNSYNQEVDKPGEPGKKTTLGEYIRFCLDGGMDFVTTNDFVVYDDNNKLLHCIAVNDDVYSQADFPIKVISASYDIVFEIESIFTKDNFERLLDTGFLSGVLSDKKKEFIKEWCKQILIQKIADMDPAPYYPTKPNIVPAGTKIVKRDDGITTLTTPTSPATRKSTNIKEYNAEEFNTIISALKDGDVLVLDQSVTVGEPLTVLTDVAIVGNGASIGEKLVASKGLNISNVNFTSKTSDPNPEKKGAMIEASGPSVKISDSSFKTEGAAYNGVKVDAKSVNITKCTFEGKEDSVYNLIEYPQTTDEPIKELTIEDCDFSSKYCRNNAINLYNFANGAVVNIRNCHFAYAANAIRLSNYLGAKNVTINIESVTFDDTTNDSYGGLLLMQAVNKYKDDFSGFTINFRNIVGPGGKRLRENGDYTKKEQIYYYYGSTLTPDKYAKITIS